MGRSRHGFFAIMGGFYGITTENQIWPGCCCPHSYKSYSLTGKWVISQRSRKAGDPGQEQRGYAISKAGPSSCKTGWFCYALASLELSNVYRATEAGACHNCRRNSQFRDLPLVWWHKPLNVQRAVRVIQVTDN